MPTLEVILLALVYESTVAGTNSDMIWQEFSWPLGFDIKVYSEMDKRLLGVFLIFELRPDSESL